MLDTLRTLESRRRVVTTPRTTLVPQAAPRLRICPVAEESQPPEPIVPTTADVVVASLAPRVGEIEGPYLDLASRIIEQLADAPCNVVLFVGADSPSASSFSLIQVAEGLALQASRDILLVDGNLRQRPLSRAAGDPTPGLSDLMRGAADWNDVIRATQIAGLDFVAAGCCEMPDDHFADPDWVMVRDTYQAVLIGTVDPGAAETSWLAGRADATYLVVSRPQTRRRDAVMVLNRLRADGANVLGSVVIND
jgi:hypothetical protein